MLEHRDRAVMARAAGDRPGRGWICWLALPALLLMMQPAWSQQTCTWNVNGPGLWSDPANWNGCAGGNGAPVGTPGPADHAVVGNIAPLADIDLGATSRVLDRLTLSAGRIHGSVDLSIATRLEWTGGSIDGGGGATLLVLEPGSNSEIAGGPFTLAKRGLRNLGTLTWASGDILVAEDAEIDNQGALVIDTFAPAIEDTAGTPPVSVLLYTDGSPLARLHNSSTPGAHVRKQGNGSAQFAPDLRFDNGNDVFVDAGRLQVMGAGGDFGAYQVAAPARLEFGMPVGVIRDLTGSNAVSGSGMLHKFGQGTLNISGGYALSGPTEVVDGTLYFDTPADPLDLPSLRVRAPGVLTGLDNLRVTGALLWEGGDIASASPGLLLTLPAAAVATIDLTTARPAAWLRSRDLVNQGSVTLSAASSIATHLWLDSASIDNQAAFTMVNNSAANQNLRLECVSTNCGSFQNRPGATLTMVDQQGIVAIGNDLAAFDNQGLVDLTEGCGGIGAPGTDTGTYRYAGSCTLLLAPRADTERVLQASAILDPIGGTSLQLGGSLRVDGASRSFGNLIIDPSATLFGPAAMTFTGSTIWRGLIEGSGPAETITVASGAVLMTSNNPGDSPLLFGRTLFNDGDINISEVRVLLDGDAEIRNNALLNLFGTPAAGGAIGCATPPLCGLITNSAGASIQSSAAFAGPPNVLEADISIDNQDALRVDSGVLVMNSAYTAGASSYVEVFPGAGLRRTAGNLVLAAGTLRGAGVIDADVDVDQVVIQPGGPGPGNLAILGDFSATSNTSYEMGIAGTLPPAVPTLGERSPQPSGVPSYDRLTIAGNASLAGTLDVIDLGYAASGVDSFDLMLYAAQLGNVVGGANPYSGVGLSLQTEATRLRLAATAGGACVWNPAGAGADVWSNASKWNSCGGGVPGVSDTAIVGAGTVDLDTPVSVGSLQFTGGTILGANDLSIITELVWTGGRFLGSGGLVSTSSGTLVSISGGQHTIDGRTFVLNSSATWTTGLIELANGGVLEIGTTGTLNSNPSLNFESIFGSGTGTAEVRNGGTIVKLGPNFSGIGQSVQYSGGGNISVQAGDFVFAATSVTTLDANYSASPGATLQFVGGNRSFGSSATLGGSGNLVFGDSSVAVGINTVDGCIDSTSTVFIRNATLVLNCAAPTTLAALLMTDPFAVLEGSSAVSISGHFGWTQGLIRGSGADPDFVLDNSATSTWSAPSGGPLVSAPEGIPTGRRIQNRRFVNHGAITWQGGVVNVLLNGGVFENAGDGSLVINVGGAVCDWDSDASAGTYLINNGLIDWVHCSQSYVSPPFDNNGTVQMADGTLYLFSSGNDTGDYLIGAGAAVSVVGPPGGGRTVWRSNRPTGPVATVRTLSSTGSVSGAGTYEVIDLAESTIFGAFTPATAATRFDGILRIDSASPAMVNDLVIELATLTGSAPIHVSGSFDWIRGTLAGTGALPVPLVLLPGSLSDWGGSGIRLMNNRAVEIQGTLGWQSGQIQVPNAASAILLVAPGGELRLDEFKATVNFGCVPAATCTAALTVDGTLRQIGEEVLLDVTQPVTVGGNLQVEGNMLSFPGMVQTGGVVNVDVNATLDVGNYTLSAGTLSGRGTVVANVDNVGGLLQPGGSPGQLNIAGDYTQGSGAALRIELAGLTPDVNADYLAVTGQATLGGTLDVVDAGYALTAPDTYEFLSAGSGRIGTFNVVNNDYAGYGITYNANSVVLAPAAGPLVVNSVGDAGDGICDTGECTLRDALLAANLMPDPDVIEFNIPAPQCTGPGGACVIAPASPLPAITGALAIDGYTQPGAVANTHAPGLGLGSNAQLKIELDGQLVSAGTGLLINAPSALVTIQGLSMYRWGTAIATQGPGDSLYQIGGNFIGLRGDGSVAPTPQFVGISIQGGGVFIGSGAADKMNVISGNQQQGISITAVPPLAGVGIRGNLIGTTVDGLAARPNGLQGILLSTPGQIPFVVIGGDLPDERNVISGNGEDGVRFDCSATSGNCFDGTQVLGNFIGPAADGAALGNLGNGVNLTSMVGGRVNIGGINPGEGNRIAFNGGNGILATFAPGGGRASFLRNDIYLNALMGIDLGGDGRTPNDVGDADTGANGLLNFPTFTSFTAPGGNSAVIDVILGTPDIGGNYPARVDFYKATEDEPSVWLGTTSCSAPAVSCPASFAFPGGVTVAPGDVVLGIVTDGFGKSSEASFYATTTTVSAPDSTIGTPYLATVEVTTAAPFTALGDVDVDDGLTESCIATLSEVSPGLASGNCLLDAVAPAATRTLTASYTPETAPPRPFSNSEGTDSVDITAGAPPLVNSDVDPGNGTCDLAECTLREAIALANATLAPDVDFDPTFFAVPRTIILTAGELVPTQDVNLNGPAAALLTVSGNNSSRILSSTGIDLSISNMALTGGNSLGAASPSVGGAILHSAGSLNLTDVIVVGNSCAAAGTGGALAVTFGNLIATRLSVTGNSCANVGGIYLQDGNLTLDDSSLTGNNGIQGEALRVSATSDVRFAALTNVTISGNSTTSANSAVRSEPQAGSSVHMTLTNVTVSGNTTTNAGSNSALAQHPSGGVHTTVLHNTIVAGNTVGGLPGDVTGTLDASSSFNVIGTGGGLSNGINGNQTGINNPLLAPLSNYGGNTLTQALLPGSPAINAGNNGLATNADQRGFARPQQGTVDVGAFESQGFVLAVLSGTPQTTPINSTFTLPLVVGVVANAGGEPVDGGQVTYSAPGAGASATFTNPAIISGGQASLVATANGVVGSYAVTASAAGAVGSPSFALTNGCPPTVVTSGNDSGAGSLRQIIADACAGSVVTFAGGVSTVNLSTAELVIAKDLTIDGGAGVTVARQPASPAFRIFRIDAGHTVVLDSLTISNGNIADDGAGILNSGNLTVLDSVLSGNNSTAGNGGGGIANMGTLAIDNSTIALNSANFAGGGVVQINGGTATISRTTLSGNSAPQGAAVMLQSVSINSSMTISNCTISGNSATLTGSGLANFASGAGTSSTLTVTSSTIANNNGPVGAIVTGVNAGAASVTLRNNIYAGNAANNVNNDAPAVIVSLGNNLSDDATGGGGPGDLINTDPLLAPLANHGGTTLTHALLPGSPAIDAGSNVGAPATDQRGVARPQLATVDIGAFESRGFVLGLLSGSPQTAPAGMPFAQPLVVSVSPNSAGEPVDGGQVSYSAPGAGPSATFVSPAAIVGGQASVVATANGILGSYSVTASATGATGAPSFALTNGTLATTTTIASVLPATTVVGQPYVVTVDVSSGGGAVTTGDVEVRQLSDGSVCSIDLSSATSCQLVASSAITTAVRATFLGAGAFAPSQSNVVSHLVERADTAITIVSDTPDPSPVGAAITVTVDLDVVAPGAGIPTGEILVTDGIASCSMLLPNLSCELAAKAVGAATLEARYLGDADFNASVDTEPHTFSADGADLAIIKRNGLRLVPGGVPSTYILLVTNAGPQAVVNARVVDILPAQFSAASWTCTAGPGASCPASGSGTVDTLVSMQAGSSLSFALTATALANPEQIVTNRATVTPPSNAPDPVPGNNESVDIDPVGIFGEGFESEDE